MKPLVVDNTMMESFRACFRRGQYRHVQHLSLPKKAAPLVFGGCIHAGLAAYYRGATEAEALTTAVAAWQVMEDSKVNSEGEETEWRTPEKLIEVLTQYFALPNTFEVLEVRGTKVIEVDVPYPLLTEGELGHLSGKLSRLGYNGVVFFGIVDLMVNWSGKKYIVDHKTTSGLYTPKSASSYIRPDYWNNYQPNKQMVGYSWLASKYFSEEVSGVIINALGCSKNNDRNCFERQTFEWTPSELEEWRIDTVRTLEMILDAMIANYYPTTGAPYYCHSYGGHCPYVELCKRPPELRDQLLDMYIVDEWNPMDARKKEASRL